MLCRHCHSGNATRPRGLCNRCCYTPGVRDLYPSTSVFARSGVRCGNPSELGLPEPTLAMPGTPEKIAVLESRCERHLALWNPLDPTAADAGTDEVTVAAVDVQGKKNGRGDFVGHMPESGCRRGRLHGPVPDCVRSRG